MVKNNNETVFVRSVLGANNIENSFLAVTKEGFRLNSVSQKTGTQSRQLLAYGAMLHHDEQVRSGQKVASFAEMHKSDAALTAYNNVLCELAMGKCPTKTPEMRGKASATFLQAFTAWRTKQAYMRQALKAACELDRVGVTSVDFDLTQQVFNVPVEALLMTGEAPLLALATKQTSKSKVTLDDTLYVATDAKADPVKVYANLARVLLVNDQRRAAADMERKRLEKEAADAAAQRQRELTGDNGGMIPETVINVSPDAPADTSDAAKLAEVTGPTPTTGTTLPGAPIVSAVATPVVERAPHSNNDLTPDFYGHIVFAAEILRSVDGEKSEPVLWSEIPEKYRNALTAIEMFIDKSRADDLANKTRETSERRSEPVIASDSKPGSKAKKAA